MPMAPGRIRLGPGHRGGGGTGGQIAGHVPLDQPDGGVVVGLDHLGAQTVHQRAEGRRRILVRDVGRDGEAIPPASLTLAFQYAAASRPGNATDKWFIEVSDDCGLTWDQVRTIQGPLVYSQINKTNAWQPSSSSHWRSSTTSLNAYAGGDPIMVKIGFISGGGNNAYLDNIELAVTLDQEEHTAQEVLLFPNPSNDGSFEVSGLEVGSPYTVVSTEGRMLQSGLLDETMKVQLHGASAGYYFFQSGGTILPLVVQ